MQVPDRTSRAGPEGGETGTNRGLGGGLHGLPGTAFGPKCLQQCVFRRPSVEVCVSFSESSPRFVPLSQFAPDSGLTEGNTRTDRQTPRDSRGRSRSAGALVPGAAGRRPLGTFWGLLSADLNREPPRGAAHPLRRG